MPGVGSVISAAAPIIGGVSSKIGSNQRQAAAQQQASRSLVLGQSSPLGSSLFNPNTQALSFSLTPRANAALSRFPDQIPGTVSIPRVDTTNIFSSFDELRKNVSGTSERVRKVIFKDLPSALAESTATSRGAISALSGTARSELNASLAQSSGLFSKLVEGEALTREELGGLLSRVRPGFGELSQAVEATIESERQRTQSDLRENLSRRRVLGSSFAEGTVASSNLEFAERKRVARAESFLAELDLSSQILQQQFGNQFQTLDLGIRRINDEISARLEQYQVELNARLQQFGIETQAQTAAGQVAVQGLLGLGDLSFETERARIQAELERAGLDQEAARIEAQQEVDRALANIDLSREEFDRLIELGKLTSEIANGLQGSFQSSSDLQQRLLAEGAAGRGAAFATSADRFGQLLQGDNAPFPTTGAGSAGIVGGSGSDFFVPSPGTSF